MTEETNGVPKQNLDTKTSQDDVELAHLHETTAAKGPIGGNRKVPKNCWKKVNIDLEYNTSREISRRRQFAWRGERRSGETYGRRDPPPKEQRRGGGKVVEENSTWKDEAEKRDRNETPKEAAEDGHAEGPARGADEAAQRKRTPTPGADTKAKGGAREDGAQMGTAQQQPRDNGAGPMSVRMPFRSGVGGGICGARRGGGSTDYWHKKGGGGGGGLGWAREDDRERRPGGSYYQKRNDRWQRNHHPNAPPPLSGAQRRARGPLPDWDEVQEIVEDSFDYMEIMESQYSQYYALSAAPSFDHSFGVIASATHSSAPVVPSVAVTIAHANVVNGPTVLPASLLSPTGLISFPLTSATALPPNAVVVAAATDQLPPSTAATQFAPVVLTAQFPSNALFAASPPATAPFIDEQKLKDLVRTQIEYYFSADNLQKDFFLRRKMDGDGFLPLSLVCGFPRVRSLTLDQNFIVTSLCGSDKVELSGDRQKVRPRLNPQQWPLVESATHAEVENALKAATDAVQIAVDHEQTKRTAEEEENGAGKEGLELPQQMEQQQRQNQTNSTEETATERTPTEEEGQSAVEEGATEEPKQQQQHQPKEEGGEDQGGWKEVRTKRNKRANRNFAYPKQPSNGELDFQFNSKIET